MEIETIIKFLTEAFFPASLVSFLMASAIYIFNKDKIYRYKAHGWLDIKKYPIPKDIKAYIATDGKEVEHFSSVTWGPYGEVIFSRYKDKYVTHWQPLPEPPKS